jgi:starch synthase
MSALGILMIAAENGSLPGGKVGGMGDVVRDVPRALAALGHRVTVVTPAYGTFHHLPKMRRRATIEAPFRGAQERLELFSLPPSGPGRRLRQFVLEHPLFSACGHGRIYCDDPPSEPFSRDSSKFALFCSATAQALLGGQFGHQDVVHLHDWHAATFAVLAYRHPSFAALAALPMVLTIHNLAMQGIRPVAWHESSLLAWFPQLKPGPELMDPRYADCYNPMRAAIRLCDHVHAVSPTYAREICDPCTDAGEGLQADLAEARDAGRLHGILNGCEYGARQPVPLSYDELLQLARRELVRWIGDHRDVRAAHLLALERIDYHLASEAPPAPKRLLTVVGRLTDQKLGLLAEHLDDGRPALAHLLDRLGEDERLLVLGSGQADIESLFNGAQAGDERLLFLCGYSEALSEQLYAAGDLFLMPSRFEPCGIAQMLAMRAGQPCLVHRTGGLADTVIDEVTGFVFEGDTDRERAAAMLERLDAALLRLRTQKRKRKAMREAAAAARFPWDAVARAYVERLYTVRPSPSDA